MEETEAQIINFERICRLCLNEKRILTEIFEPTADNNNLTIDQKIMACATIDLCKDDGLPSRICIKCLASVNAAFEFRIQCENADKTLHDLHNLFMNSETNKGVEESAIGSVEKEKGREKEANNKEKNGNGRKQVNVRKIKGTAAVGVKGTEDLTDLEDIIPVHQFLETPLYRGQSCSAVRDKGLTLSKVHKCEECNKTFTVRKSLVRHNANCHGMETEKRRKVHECSVCSEVFPRWSGLYEHQKTFGHHGKEKCKYCGKVISRTYILEHMRNHTGEKPFLCNHCGQSFGQMSSFYKHRKLCSNTEKKLKCSYCDKRYYERHALVEHERIHTNERPFVCETCGKAFRLKGKLRIHQLSHKNIKPHSCSVCQRAFRQRGHLTEHFRIHSGVKPFTCDVCGAAFTQGHSLKSHKAKHPEVNMTSL